MFDNGLDIARRVHRLTMWLTDATFHLQQKAIDLEVFAARLVRNLDPGETG